MTFYWLISLPCEDHYSNRFVEIKLPLQSGTRRFTTVHRLHVHVMSEQWETRLWNSFCSCTHTYEFVLIILFLCFVMLYAPIWRNTAHKKARTSRRWVLTLLLATTTDEGSAGERSQKPGAANMNLWGRLYTLLYWTEGTTRINWPAGCGWPPVGPKRRRLVSETCSLGTGSECLVHRPPHSPPHRLLRSSQTHNQVSTKVVPVDGWIRDIARQVNSDDYIVRAKHINTSTNLIWLTVYVTRHLLVDERLTTKAGRRKAGSLTIHDRCNDVLI